MVNSLVTESRYARNDDKWLRCHLSTESLNERACLFELSRSTVWQDFRLLRYQSSRTLLSRPNQISKLNDICELRKMTSRSCLGLTFYFTCHRLVRKVLDTEGQASLLTTASFHCSLG